MLMTQIVSYFNELKSVVQNELTSLMQWTRMQTN